MKIYLTLLIITLLPFLIGISLPEKDSPAGKIISYEDFNPEHLDGAFTGGFGEQTCHTCHFDYDLNQEGGTLTVDGINDTFEAGKSYELTITVGSEQLEIGGFQMSSRFEDGTQAGMFEWESDRLMITPSISDEIQYVQHSEKGTRPVDNHEVSWSLSWQAPEEDSGPVIFNIAANAGNHDDSSFGDWIYTKEIVLKSGQ